MGSGPRFSALFASATIAFARAKPSFSSMAESASARSSSLAKSGYTITVSGHPLRHISLVPTIHARPSSHLRPFSVIEYVGIAGFSLGEMVISPSSDSDVAICATLHCPPRPCAASARSSVYQFQFLSEAESNFSMVILMSSLIVVRLGDKVGHPSGRNLPMLRYVYCSTNHKPPLGRSAARPPSQDSCIARIRSAHEYRNFYRIESPQNFHLLCF
ncbi:hypothetical protein GO283_01337 [Ralstonia solanacearum]|nr:hypothetical protein [Ralstonia solanacearum]NJZ77508.1 hypothetical protein [Ralstonia solanacearum]NJZ81151.1 hypothetical protein [Ralstonia solanacearum]NKA08650.1 hypothetical protein [Ralstonia solanacearum]NKA34027.1 hypothetical protein [Ralstonia solanacearum]